jgi:hypothetical protein
MKLKEMYDNLFEGIENKYQLDGGDVILYHYSNVKIKGNYIKVRGTKQGAHSASEYREWGQSRAFFYVKKSGIKYDRGIGLPKYLYICKIPKSKIYPANENPNDYDPPMNIPYTVGLHDMTTEDGYTAWSYYLGNNKKAPIVVSFEDVEIVKRIKVN